MSEKYFATKKMSCKTCVEKQIITAQIYSHIY